MNLEDNRTNTVDGAMGFECARLKHIYEEDECDTEIEECDEEEEECGCSDPGCPCGGVKIGTL